MKLVELKSLRATELEKYTDMFHSDMTDDQLKEVLGADDFNAKMRYLCSKPNKKHGAAVKESYAHNTELTSIYTALRPENKHIINEVANA